MPACSFPSGRHQEYGCGALSTKMFARHGFPQATPDHALMQFDWNVVLVLRSVRRTKTSVGGSLSAGMAYLKSYSSEGDAIAQKP
jgi:hypothetical protein